MSLFYGQKNPGHPHPPNQGPQEANKRAQNKENRDINSRQSILLAKDPEKEPGCCDKCCSCSCCDCSTLKDNFKVTNKEVAKRIGSNLKFWSGGFFTPAEQQYDLYGPFWLYTTLIFVVGAVHNILLYKNNPHNFQYDFQILAKSMTVFYGMGLLLSFLLGLIYGCLGLPSKVVQIVCLYGYSMAIYVIAVLLCTLNMTLLTWIFLLYAATTKVIFILKNIFELDVPASKKFAITIIVAIEAGLQFLIIKFGFIKTSNSGTLGGAFSHMSAEPSGFLHLRHQANL